MYIMASNKGTLYVGFCNNIERRGFEHKTKTNNGFTEKYNCNKLVYYEQFDYVYDAIEREKQVKKWRRNKKENIIRSINSKWEDLAKDW